MMKHEIQKSKVACFFLTEGVPSATRRGGRLCTVPGYPCASLRGERRARQRELETCPPQPPHARRPVLAGYGLGVLLLHSLSPPRPTRPRNHARACRLQQPLPPSPSPAAGGVVYCTIA
jgi:hypothetical protein